MGLLRNYGSVVWPVTVVMWRRTGVPARCAGPGGCLWHLLVVDLMFYCGGDFGDIKAAAPGIFRGWGKLVADGTADRWRRGEVFPMG